MQQPYSPYSVCMSVYKNDNAANFMTALRSMARQTVTPNEIILVIDGPINEALEQTIVTFSQEFDAIHIVRFAENRGHAAARQASIDNAHNDWMAIMDSDDIALPNRMEKQLQYLQSHTDVDIVGGQIEEFIDSISHIVGKRIVPLSHIDILRYMQSRCPMNMQTILAKKKSILSVGGFQNWYCEEDYYLWIRMALAGCIFANIDDTLAYVRVGKEMYQRRGGWKYFKSEKGIQRYMLRHKMISFPRYCYNVLGRFVVQVLMTNRVRGFVFQKLFRK